MIYKRAVDTVLSHLEMPDASLRKTEKLLIDCKVNLESDSNLVFKNTVEMMIDLCAQSTSIDHYKQILNNIELEKDSL